MQDDVSIGGVTYSCSKVIAAEIERLRDVSETALSWLERWAEHVGDCETGDRCTCGLTAVRHGLTISIHRFVVGKQEPSRETPEGQESPQGAVILDNTLMIRRNSKPVQPVDRERGFMWESGRKFPVPDAPELKTAVLPQFKINE